MAEPQHPAVKHARYYDLLMACKVMASFHLEDWDSLTPEQQRILRGAANRIARYSYGHQPYEQTKEQ